MDFHAVIHHHAASLPGPVIAFSEATQHHYSFQEKLLLLEEGLSTYAAHLPAQQYFKYLFLGLCQYYLQKQTYMTYLRRASNMGLFPEISLPILPLTQKQASAGRILVVTSLDDAKNTFFKKLSEIHDHITVVVADDAFSSMTLLSTWGTYDQVFIVGHGEDKSETYEGHIRLGSQLLKPGMIADALNAHQANPPVLGIFTCGEAFYAMESRNQFDYFIADHQSSVPRFVEMFLYGYLLTYFKSYNVLQAFKAGRLATIFMAKSDPTYQIFARGIKLHE